MFKASHFTGLARSHLLRSYPNPHHPTSTVYRPDMLKHCQGTVAASRNSSTARISSNTWPYLSWAGSNNNATASSSTTLMVRCMGVKNADVLAPSDQLPLYNKRILVTAPRQYASKLTGLLVDAGAQPVWVPGVSISRLTDKQHLQQLDDALLRLSTFSHLAFTSKNGILAVLERLAHLKGGPHAASAYLKATGIQLCALGADGQVLQQAGLQVDVSPKEASTKGLAAELTALTPDDQAVRVLCPVPHVTGGLVEPPVVPRFLEALQSGGAKAVRVPAYLTTVGLSGPEACAAEAGLLHEGYFDAIAFSSTAEAQGLCLLMGGREALVQAVQQHNVVLAAHGPYTAAGAGDVLGLPIKVVSRNFTTFDGLVAVLGEALTSNNFDE